ncbi:MAG: hypothetical protein AB1749_13375 [Pseudomonadota bacterium]
MTASGAIDGDNLWITAVQHALPTLRAHAIGQPLLKRLDQLAEQIPSVLWKTIQALVAPAQVRDMLVVACFKNIHHNKRLQVEHCFRDAGFRTQDAGSSESQATDHRMQMQMALQFAECARHGDSVYVGVASDYFLMYPIQEALQRSHMDVVAINFKSNSGRFMRETKDLRREFRNRLRVHHNEADPDFRKFWLACTEVDPLHARWRATAVADKVKASAIRSLLSRERDIARPRRPGEKMPRPPQNWELRGWIGSWLENYANYSSMIGDPPVPCSDQIMDEMYASLRDQGVVEEFKDPSLRRGNNVTFVRLNHSTKEVADSVGQIDANFTQYTLDHHVL